MTREELKAYAYNKIIESNRLLIKESPELEFYEDFFEENQFNNKKNYLNLSLANILTAYLGIADIDEKFDRMRSDCITMAQVLKKIPHEMLYNSIIDADNYVRSVSREERHKKKMFSKVNKGELDIYSNFAWVDSGAFDQSRRILVSKYINEYETDMTGALFLASVVNYIEECKKKVDKEISPNANEKERINRYIYEIEEHVDFKGFHKCINIVKGHYAKLKREELERTKAIQKDIRGYEKVLNEIDKAFKPEEITDYRSFIKNIPDEIIRKEFLKLVYEHNNEYYSKLNRKHQNINEDTKLHYYALLEKDGIHKEDVDIYQMMEQDYETFSESIRELHKISDNKEFIIKGLQESNLERIKDLVALKDKGYIKSEAILENADLLELDNEKYTKFNKSIDYISEKNLNPGIFLEESDLLMDDENIKEKLDVLEKEDKLYQLKNTESYEFFKIDNLKEKIDMIRRLDLSPFIREDLDILNEENFERIEVLNDIDYKIESKEELVDILRDDNFLVPDNRINEYISKSK